MVCEAISVPTGISTATMGRVHAASAALPWCVQFWCCADLSGRDGPPEVFHKPVVETRVCQNSPAALPVMTATPSRPIRARMCLACVSSDKPLIILLWAELDMPVRCGCVAAHSKWNRLTVPPPDCDEQRYAFLSYPVVVDHPSMTSPQVG